MIINTEEQAKTFFKNCGAEYIGKMGYLFLFKDLKSSHGSTMAIRQGQITETEVLQKIQDKRKVFKI